MNEKQLWCWKCARGGHPMEKQSDGTLAAKPMHFIQVLEQEILTFDRVRHYNRFYCIECFRTLESKYPLILDTRSLKNMPQIYFSKTDSPEELKALVTTLQDANLVPKNIEAGEFILRYKVLPQPAKPIAEKVVVPTSVIPEPALDNIARLEKKIQELENKKVGEEVDE